MQIFHARIHKFLLLWGLLLSMFILVACSATPATQVDPSAASTPLEAISEPAIENEVLPTETIVEQPSPTATSQPSATDTPPEENFVSFSNDVYPIIEFRCLNCHGGEKIEEGLNLTDYFGLMNGSINGAIVTPGDAENSLFVEMVASQKMPKRGAKLTPAQVQIFRDWVNQGALEN
ncbi:MAG: c-type cytochrome domain-containing protein [Anaerolineaceae bacterium]|nr:c-type cytochrome domain-containing protein [Anaerolineaceae bacterium]